MKQFILLGLVCLCAYATKAQTLTVNNNSSCDIFFQAAAGTTPFPCFQHVGNPTVIQAGSTGNVYSLSSFSWSPSAPSAGTDFTYFRYANGDFSGGTICSPTMSGPVGSCLYDISHVGDCAGATSCIETSSNCGSCPIGTTVNVNWTGGTNAIVDIF